MCFLVLLGIILVLGVLRMLRGKQGKRICFPGYRQVTYRLYRLVRFPVSVFVFHPSVLGFYLFLLSDVMTLDWPVQTGINGIHPVYHLFYTGSYRNVTSTSVLHFIFQVQNVLQSFQNGFLLGCL